MGALPDTQSYSIAAQSHWLGLIFEVCDEGLLLPLLFVLGAVRRDTNEMAAAVRGGLLVVAAVFGLLAIAVILGAPLLVASMAQPASLVDSTVSYIRLETIGLALGTLAKCLSIPLLLLQRSRALAWLLATQCGSNLLGDSCLLGAFPFSLHLGVSGVAWTNILVQGGQTALAAYFLRTAGITALLSSKLPTAGWFGLWWSRGWRSGLESLIRNAAFAVMVLRLVNEVQEQKSFWVANQVIWGLLLVPVLAIGELIRRDFADRPGAIRSRLSGYLQFTGLVVLAWLVFLPCLPSFLKVILRTPDPVPVMNTIFWLLGFYVLFAFNHLVDSVFYGLGRTDFMLSQTIFVNVSVYGVAFGLYLAGVFVPSLFRIICLFGLGIVVDCGITFLKLRRLLREEPLTNW